MRKILLTTVFIVVSSLGLHADEILYSCDSAKSELYDLVKVGSNKGYKQDSLKLKLISRDKKIYVKAKDTENELIDLGGYNPQYLEKIGSGHHVLYTIHKDKNILTIQKSYDFFGPIMVNIILQCK